METLSKREFISKYWEKIVLINNHILTYNKYDVSEYMKSPLYTVCSVYEGENEDFITMDNDNGDAPFKYGFVIIRN